MIPFKGALWTLGAVAAAMLLWFGYGKYREYSVLRDAEKNRQIAVQTAVVAHADTVYDTTRVGYIQYRDRILKSGTATKRDSATFKKADAVVTACDTLKGASRQLETVLRDAPTGVRRLQTYGEVLYDFSARAPVARLGATAKIVGPVSLSGAVDISIPPAGESHVTTRLLLGARINF